MSISFWTRLRHAYSPGQILILRICAVIIVIGSIILAIDAFIVQPSRAAQSPPFSEADIEVTVDLPKLDLGLDEIVEQNRQELERIRHKRDLDRDSNKHPEQGEP